MYTFQAEFPPYTVERETWGSSYQVKNPVLGIQQKADHTGLLVSPQMAEAEATQLKEEGNQHFQLQDYKAATKSYSQALKLTKDKALLATLYRNRAACGLKMVWEQDSLGGLRAVKAGDKVVMADGSEPSSSSPHLLDPLSGQMFLLFPGPLL